MRALAPLALLAILACGPVSAEENLRQSEIETVVATAPVNDYRLGPGDKVRVTVYDETDLSGEFQVDDTGFVRLPLIGPVKALARTAHQLEGDVSTALLDG